jgi:hypothetical protein
MPTTLEKHSEHDTQSVMNSESHQPQVMSIESATSVEVSTAVGKAVPAQNQPQPFCFSHRFSDTMLMGAKIQTVADYLDAHQGWFTRCAQPMQVQPIGKNGYDLTIGKYDSFGYSIEPKVGLELLPQDNRVYRIRTVEIPNYTPPGYEVFFDAEMRLVEAVNGNLLLTKVEWDLDLRVYIKFPKFIYKLPTGVIQGTGDKCLKQIVAHVSRRLTHKVQQDFHGNLGLKIPKA